MTVESGVRPGRMHRGRRWLRSAPWSIVLSVLVLGPIVLSAVLPAIAPHDPTVINNADILRGPSAEHILGTDQLGRDVLSRLIAGARTALFGPLLVAGATVAISTALALIAGWTGGWVDAVISRAVDFLYSVPALVVAIVIVGVLDGGYYMAIAVLVVFGLPQNMRVVRAAVLERVNLPYIEAARTLGVRGFGIVLQHLLPGILPIVVASFFLQFAYGIVDLSSLAFLGLGVPPGASDWGRQLAENRVSVYDNFWAAAAPGLALVAVAASMNLIGDWWFARFEKAQRDR